MSLTSTKIMPWRPVYETYASIAWWSLVPIYMIIGYYMNIPFTALMVGTLILFVMGSFRLIQAWNIWTIRLSLEGSPPRLIRPDAIAKHSRENKDTRWLGIGFDWLPSHTQRVYELKKIDPQMFYAPKLFKKIISKLEGENHDKPVSIGAPWIHGVEPETKNVFVPYEVFYGHTVIFGTTGSGKTRLNEILVSQDIHRGNVVIQIDPKGDKELEKRMELECRRAGRRFIKFHLAFPNESVRFDTLKNYNRPTEFASRISSLIPSETGSDTFTAFAWNVLNAINLGLLEISEKPSLTKIRRYVEGGIEPLLEKVMVSYFAKMDQNWDVLANRYVSNQSKDISRAPTPAERVRGYLNYYNSELVVNGKSYDVIDGLVTIYEHDAAHFGKMIANLNPILSMLTSGELGKMLSPDYDDPTDKRDIWDFEKIIESGCCAYFGLDSLSDATVSSAVGSLLLSDAASVAGAIYNFAGENQKKISLFVDEASEVVNPPFVTILNKGRGAGFMSYVFTQTKSDFESKLGNVSKARMMLGNFNNVITLRLRDGDTQEYISETFEEHYVSNNSLSQGTGSSSEDNVYAYAGRISESRTQSLEKAIPLDILGKLPNFHYIASIGGRVIKGEFPLLKS